MIFKSLLFRFWGKVVWSTHMAAFTRCVLQWKTEGLRKKGGGGNKRLKEESHAESVLCIRYLLGLCRASVCVCVWRTETVCFLYSHTNQTSTPPPSSDTYSMCVCVLEWIWLRVSFCVFYNVACERPYGDVMMIKAVMVPDGRHSHINSAPEFNASQRLSLAMFGMKYCLLNSVRSTPCTACSLF